MKATHKVASLSQATVNTAQPIVYTCKMVDDELQSVFGSDQIERAIPLLKYNGVHIPYDRSDALRPYQMAKQGFNNLLYSFSGLVAESEKDNFVFGGLVRKSGMPPVRYDKTNFYGGFLIYASYDAQKKNPTINFIHSNMSGFGRILRKSAVNINVREWTSVFDGFQSSTAVRGNLALGAQTIHPRIILEGLYGYDHYNGAIDRSFFETGDCWWLEV
jgi:hypothetical protein